MTSDFMLIYKFVLAELSVRPRTKRYGAWDNYDLTEVNSTNKAKKTNREGNKSLPKFAFRHQDQIKQTTTQTNKYQTHQRHQNGGRLTGPTTTWPTGIWPKAAAIPG